MALQFLHSKEKLTLNMMKVVSLSYYVKDKKMIVFIE